MTSGFLMDVKRFAVHDGPGIRTTLFLKGCSLRCIWCHNPEGISHRAQLAYYDHKCLRCGLCVSVCPYSVHAVTPESHILRREACTACGRCAEPCPGQALKKYGSCITPEEAVELLLEDREFYAASGGGATLSGGEPLLQADFCRETLALLRQEGIHTCVDTCGNVPWESFEQVLPYTSRFLFDVKHADPEAHRQLTGADNRLILSNLRRLNDAGAEIEIRMPLVPGCNDDEATLRAIGTILGPLHIVIMRILPYHSMARSKYASLGMPDTMPDVPSPSDDRLNEVAALLQACGVNAVSGRA